ncbi:uncharacterized protein LOC131887855 [Tigriopus californicus]|uniref:uncharacterized protein LOC131887855 n=1 Tax=Tigriopus californicus TaxID=6832 RepID=UPI0027DA63D7|nr:uncharacterized protein LOC131887855 [Tigriopus californicus]
MANRVTHGGRGGTRGSGRFPVGSTPPRPQLVCPKVEGQSLDFGWTESPFRGSPRGNRGYRGRSPMGQRPQRGSYAFFPGVKPVVSANMRLGDKCRPPILVSTERDENDNPMVELVQDEPMTPPPTSHEQDNLFTGCEEGASEDCLCHRPPTVIMCRMCGHMLVGRVRKRCLAHPRHIYLYDLNRCPISNCLAVASMLLETSYPVEMFERTRK